MPGARDLQALCDSDIDGSVALSQKAKAATIVDDMLGAVAEAPIRYIKEMMEFRRFSFRGLQKVEAVGPSSVLPWISSGSTSLQTA